MTEEVYKLRSVLQGHSMDVKAVSACSDPPGALLTASRDKTARLWYQHDDNSHSVRKVYRGHSKYVSCAVFVEASEEFPSGLIYTGCQDGKIRAFLPDVEEPLFLLEGHSENVVSMHLGKFGTLISGSWDMTAKVWVGRKVSLTLTGHDAAVWAVAILPEVGVMITGSADKTVRLWKAGKVTHTLKGHTDAVRSIAVVDSSQFLSASNDASVRRWNSAGECLGTYFGHTNYIYSICLLGSGGDSWVTSGEDRSVRVWKGREVVQTIYIPAISVWSVTVLANGDIAAATNDGAVRLFTRDPTRFAAPEIMTAFEEELAACSLAAQQELGGIKLTDLPGPEALYEPGAKDGQQKMVREGQKVSVHSWNMAEQKWDKIGDVVGAAGGTEETSGKKLYRGKEYDFVFDIEIDEPKATLKLPYNTTDDPYMAAQSFIHTNGMSQYYLEEIANHIIKNTGGVPLGTDSAGNCDPMTGGGSYKPDAISGSSSGGGGSVDPFTGSGAYTSSSGGAMVGGGGGVPDPWMQGAYRTEEAMQVDVKPVNNYFPHKEFLFFNSLVKAEPLVKKLGEFNNLVADDLKLDTTIISSLPSLADPNPQEGLVPSLMKILSWPDENIFPGLDIIRLAVLNPANKADIFEKDILDKIYSSCLQQVDNTAPVPCQMIALRTLSNLCSSTEGETLLRTYCQSVVNRVMDKLLPVVDNNKHIQIAASTLILNLAISFSNNVDEESLAQLLTPLGLHFMEHISDWEARFRTLVAIGTILATAPDTKEFAKAMDVKESVRGWRILEGPSKVSECAKFIEALL